MERRKEKPERAARSRTLAQAAGADGNSREKIHSDVQGSYTGVPEDGGRPVQDADDL